MTTPLPLWMRLGGLPRSEKSLWMKTLVIEDSAIQQPPQLFFYVLADSKQRAPDESDADLFFR